MSRRRWCIGLAVLITPIAALVGYLKSLPTTTEGWFEFKTGFQIPESAVILTDVSDYSTGLSTEGYSEFVLRIDPVVARQWLASSPPWQDEWTCSADADTFVLVRLPDASKYTFEGDQGLGQELAINPTDGTVWYATWSY